MLDVKGGGVSLVEKGKNTGLPITSGEGIEGVAHVFLVVRSIGQSSVGLTQVTQYPNGPK